MAATRVLFEGYCGEDADLSDVAAYRVGWDDSPDDAQTFGPVTLAPGNSLAVPVVAASFASQVCVMVRGQATITIRYGSVSGATVDLYVDAMGGETVLSNVPKSAERPLLLPSGPITTAGPWSTATHSIYSVTITAIVAGAGTTVRGWVAN